MTKTERTEPVLWRITISPRRSESEAQGSAVLRDIHELGLTHVERVASSRLFFLQGNVSAETVERIAGRLLADPITETFAFSRGGDDRRLPSPEADGSWMADRLDNHKIDCLSFFSPSAFQFFLDLVGGNAVGKIIGSGAAIAAIGDEDVTLDLNHPLAGRTLSFSVEIVSIA